MSQLGPSRHPCPDCKGSGVYQGLGAPEDCQACGGAGEFAGISVDVYPEGIKKEDWDELSKSFKLNITQKDDITFIEGNGAPNLKIGEMVYIYDASWYEGKAAHLYENIHGGQMVRVDSNGGIFRIATKNICWNLTENRWEYIRSGTPVW